MFEILFTIDALVEVNKQGGRVYKITENQVLENDAAFSSFLKTVYQQDVRSALKTADSLKVALQLRSAPWLMVEKTMHLRDDGQFEGEDIQPTAELLPLITPTIEKFIAQVQPGDVFSLKYSIERY
jgi:hypothetical protein